MTEQVRRAWTAWKRLSFARKIRLFGYAVLLIAAVELAVVSSVYDQLLPFWQGFLINFGTDALGVAITVLVLNALQERAQEEQLKKQLIREMGSRVRDVAVPAAEKMSDQGWLCDGSLERAFLGGANLEGARLTTAHLKGAYLTVANLTEAYLIGANLIGASLTKANLEGAWLTAANLTEAHLTEANLRGAKLAGANLTGADLRGANLTGAYVKGADLTGAELTGADLDIPNLIRSHLAGDGLLTEARYNGLTKWPAGSNPKLWGAINVDEQAVLPTITEEQGDD